MTNVPRRAEEVVDLFSLRSAGPKNPAMRILRLDLGDGSSRVDLHPFITVLQGLSAEDRADVVAGIRALVAGRDPGIGGLVQCGGVLVELPWPSGPMGPVILADVFLDVDALSGDPRPALLARLDQVARQAALDADRLAALIGRQRAGSRVDDPHSGDQHTGLERAGQQRIADLERRLQHSRRLKEELELRVASLGPPPVAVPEALAAAVHRLAGEACPPDPTASVPLVLYGSLAVLPHRSVVELLERLEPETDRAQIVLLTDHPTAARWARDVGQRRALCSRPIRPSD